MKLSQKRKVIVLDMWKRIYEEVEDIFGDMKGYIPSYSRLIAEKSTDDIEKALNDYTESIVRMVEEELKGMQYDHEYCDDCHYHEALDNLQTYLNDIKEELGK